MKIYGKIVIFALVSWYHRLYRVWKRGIFPAYLGEDSRRSLPRHSVAKKQKPVILYSGRAPSFCAPDGMEIDPVEKKSFVGGAAILAGAGLLVRFIGAVYRIPLNNLVGAEGMAYYGVVYQYYSALLVISSAGLPAAISKMVSERVTLGDYRAARAVFRTAFRLLLGIGILTTAFMFFGADVLASFTYGKDAAVEISKQALSFKAMAPSLFFVSLMCAYRGYLQGLQRMTGTAVSQVMEQIGKLGFGFYLAMTMLPRGPEYAAMGALIGVSLSEFLALVSIWLFYLRQKKSLAAQLAQSTKSKTKSTFANISKQLLAIAIPITIGASVMPITGIVDNATIIRLLTGAGYTTEAAKEAYSLLYSFVTPIINMPAVLSLALGVSLVPAVSAYMAKKDYKHVRNASRTSMKLALIIGAPCTIGLFVLAQPVLAMLYPVLKEQQLAVAAGLLQTGCIGVLFLTIVQTLTGIIQGLGRPNVPVMNLLFGGVLKVITLFILMRIPTINIQGAAVSTVVCYATAGILDMTYLIRKTKLKVKYFDMFGKPLLAALVMGALVSLLYGVIGDIGWNRYLSTLCTVAAGVVAYLLAIIALKAFSPEDLAFIPGGRRLERIFGRTEEKK